MPQDRLIRLDLRQLGRRLQYNASSSGASSLDLLRSLLSVFLTFGLDECCDTACIQGLGIVKPETTVAVGEQKWASNKMFEADHSQCFRSLNLAHDRFEINMDATTVHHGNPAAGDRLDVETVS